MVSALGDPLTLCIHLPKSVYGPSNDKVFVKVLPETLASKIKLVVSQGRFNGALVFFTADNQMIEYNVMVKSFKDCQLYVGFA